MLVATCCRGKGIYDVIRQRMTTCKLLLKRCWIVLIMIILLCVAWFVANNGGYYSASFKRAAVKMSSGLLTSIETHSSSENRAAMNLRRQQELKTGKRVLTMGDHSLAPTTPYVNFDPHGNDTLVLIHTQKTGGTTFSRYLVTITKGGENLCLLSEKVKRSIRERKRVPKGKKGMGLTDDSRRGTHILCPRNPSKPKGEQWLIAERTMGWVCGLHASFMEYKKCLSTLQNSKFSMKSKLHYAIFLRHPVLRYISEYLHVQRNATWIRPHFCGGKLVSEVDMPPCYPGYYQKKPWVNLTLSSFVACESNWANNRQTMMLADLEAVDCYNQSALSKETRERRLLESAKQNLLSFSFFGITEYMIESCSLFEKMFGLEFAVVPPPRNLSMLHSGPLLLNLWNNSDIFNAILKANNMDMKLYEFALEVFTRRAQSVGVSVNKNLIEEEMEILRSNPRLTDKTIAKYKKLKYNIS